MVDVKMDDKFTTEEVFESAVSIVRNLPKEGSIKPSDELKLKLYAYFKQATRGPNDTPKPRFYHIVEVYKWDAWHKLGNMSKEDAMLSYINELKQVMDTIPKEEPDPEANKRFEDVLGKKFYDYWFKQFTKTRPNEQLGSASDLTSLDRGSYLEPRMSKSNDTQSNSSGGSSISMLEETQSGGDGYKTPNSLVLKETFAGEVNDQFASAILRLQQGLEETSARLRFVEIQLEQTVSSVKKIENQTYAKQPLTESGRYCQDTTRRPKGLLGALRNLQTVHWFYLSYPFLVYFIIRRFERRNRQSR